MKGNISPEEGLTATITIDKKQVYDSIPAPLLVRWLVKILVILLALGSILLGIFATLLVGISCIFGGVLIM
jgi:hypothetical protein